MALARPNAGVLSLEAGDVVTTQRDDHPHLATTVVSILKRERALIAEQLAKGSVKDYPTYREIVGRIDGLDIAISHAQQVQKRLDG